MKKVFVLIALLITTLILTACQTGPYEIAMITDTGDIDDGSFNQGTWEGIEEYALANNISHKYYKPAGESVDDYVAAIDLAVSGGAKIVITPGYYFEVPIFQAQSKYPDVTFVIIDGSPHNGDYNVVMGEKTLSIFFREEEAGFLAGYAVIKEGLRQLGFMGGQSVPAVQRFGIGWIAGAYYAANELGLTDYTFNPNYYTYLGTFGPSDEYKTRAASWYTAGVEVIHAAAGGAGSSVMAAAADATNKWVVGVDSDQANDSPTVITSALKGVGEAAINALTAFYSDQFPGGETWNLSAEQNAVGLPMETSRFTTFTEAMYNQIFEELKANITVPNTAEDLTTFVAGLGYVINPALIALI